MTSRNLENCRRMARRSLSFWLALPVLCLAAAPASALSMRVVTSQVFADAFARAETNVDDPPIDTASGLEIEQALAIFIQGDESAVATSQGIASRIPFLSRPSTLSTNVELDASARTSSSLEAEASVIGGGTVRLQLSGSPGEPAAALAFNLSLDPLVGVLGTEWFISYTVVNETLGTTLFSISTDDPGTVPTDFVLGVGFGDLVRVEWFASLAVFAQGGQNISGRIDFDSVITPLVIPEPGPAALLLSGLALLAVRRSRR